MAFKLNKQESTRRDQLVSDLGDAAKDLEEAVSVYNNEMAKLRGPLDAAIEKYNGLVVDARDFAEDIAAAAEAAIDDKSDRWKESEKGEAATNWKDAWSCVSLDDVEVEYPEELSIDVTHAETLDDLPSEAES